MEGKKRMEMIGARKMTDCKRIKSKRDSENVRQRNERGTVRREKERTIERD